MQLIQEYASFITLLMFGIYIIGRIITIFAVKPLIKDRILCMLDDYDIEKYNLVDEVQIANDDNIYGIIVSREGIRNIKVYGVKEIYDQRGFLYQHRKGNLLYSRDFLNVDETLAICIELGEILPTAFIEYETIDYLKVRIEWAMNGKNGVMSEIINPQHTVKSVLYYLLR